MDHRHPHRGLGRAVALTTVDRSQLADFLRVRREALQPEDVGLPRGPRRRADGLRREEVAALAGMSVDYYARLEQERGPQPSEQMLAAIARGLHLSLDERDHLFRLAGHTAPRRALRTDHVQPGLMRVLDRLADTPAEVITDLGEALVQTEPAKALLGDATRFTGLNRALVHRWFTDPGSRVIYPVDDHEVRGRQLVADLRGALSRQGPRSRAARIVDELLGRSEEFVAFWSEHQVDGRTDQEKRIWHPEVGEITLFCQVLLDRTQAQALLVFTATPGTESAEKLQLLSVLGARDDVHPAVAG